MSKIPLSGIAITLRKLRSFYEISNAELSSRLGIHSNTYRNYEEGKREITFSALFSLSIIYDLSLDDMVDTMLVITENDYSSFGELIRKRSKKKLETH